MTLIVVELLLAAVGCVAFVVRYALRSEWRKTTMGRHIMAFMLVMSGGVLTLFGLAVGVHVPLWVFAIGFAAFDVVLFQRLWLLWRYSANRE